MSSSDDNDDRLDGRLRRLIDSEFDGHERSEVSDALQKVAEELGADELEEAAGETDPDGEGDSTRTGRASLARTSSGTLQQVSTVKDAAGLDAFSSTIVPFDVDRDGERPLITVSPRGREQLSRVFEQLLDVKALWLKLEDPPAANLEVEVLLDIPEYGFENAITGRVVHRTETSAAVDISSIGEDEFESIEEVYERHTARLEADSATETHRRLGVEPTSRNTVDEDVNDTWDGSPSSSLALSRTFETVTEQDSYWYGPRSAWIEPRGVGPSEEVFEGIEAETLLLEVSKRAFTGLVEFASEERNFQLLAEEGHIVAVAGRPHHAREELGPMLRVAERVSEDELAKASSFAIKKEISLEMALAQLEIISAEEIRQAVAGRLTYMLRMICDFGEGDARLTDRGNLSHYPVPSESVRAHVPVESVIFRRRIDRFHRLGSDERDARIDEYGDRYPDVASDAEGRIPRAFADEAHRTFVRRLIDGSTSLRDLIATSFLPPAEAVSVLDALWSMDLVVFRDDPSNADSVIRFQDDIHIKHLSVHKASYFEVLNIHWSSYDDAVERAYRQQRDYFDPESAHDLLNRESERRLEEIAERIDSAYRVLKKRKSRHAYRKKIMPEYKLKHGIPLLMRRGRLARERGTTEVARDAFARVLEIDPERSEAAGELRALQGSS